jgi:Arc/MetJ family transcription regulator
MEVEMRTTIDIDRQILERAKTALQARSYKEAIEQALEQAVRQAELRRLMAELEGSDLTWDVDELLAYRRMDRGDAL